MIKVTKLFFILLKEFDRIFKGIFLTANPSLHHGGQFEVFVKLYRPRVIRVARLVPVTFTKPGSKQTASRAGGFYHATEPFQTSDTEF